MAELFNILKVTVAEDKICAHVLVNPGMPLMTSEDIEATARVYYLVPAIAKHLCLGDAGREFQDCMGATELAHLLEHVTVELMNETGLAGKIACGRTRVSEHDERVFEVEISCPDDALTIGALSSATFMMDWAFLHADQPAPDVEGTVEGLRRLVLGMRAELEGTAVEGGADEGAELDPEAGLDVIPADAFDAEAAAGDAETAADAPVAAEDGFAVEEPDGEVAPGEEVPAESAPASAAASAPAPEPAGVPAFDDAPRGVIDTEGAHVDVRENVDAVFGGAAVAPHEQELPLVSGAFDMPATTPAAVPVPAPEPAPAVEPEPVDPDATVTMPAQP